MRRLCCGTLSACCGARCRSHLCPSIRSAPRLLGRAPAEMIVRLGATARIVTVGGGGVAADRAMAVAVTAAAEAAMMEAVPAAAVVALSEAVAVGIRSGRMPQAPRNLPADRSTATLDHATATATASPAKRKVTTRGAAVMATTPVAHTATAAVMVVTRDVAVMATVDRAPPTVIPTAAVVP